MNEMEEKSKEAQQSEPAVWAKLCAYGHMQEVELERIHTPRFNIELVHRSECKRFNINVA